jgi:hypothetical protein
MTNLLKAALLPALTALAGRAESSLGATGGAYAGVDVLAGQPFAGTQGRLNPADAPVQFAPSVEGNAPGTAGRWQANADVQYPLGARGAAWSPYAGAGLCLVGGAEKKGRSVGVNFLGGVNVAIGPLDGFVQARLTLAHGVHLSLTAGAVPSGV